MKTFLKALVLVPVAILAIAFAVANRQVVSISFDPFSSGDPVFVLAAQRVAPVLLVRTLSVLVDALLPEEHLQRWETQQAETYLDVRELLDGYADVKGVLDPETAVAFRQALARRALAARPKLLLLDEPTEGIQPSVVQQIEGALERVRSELGVAVLLVEQYLEFAWRFADRYLVLQRGRVVAQGETATDDREGVAKLLHV